MNKQNRQKVASVVLFLTGMVGLVVFGLWAVVGTVVGLMVVFVGSVVTLGLGVWPLGILCILVFWGPLFLASWGAQKLEPLVKGWVEREPVDPDDEAQRAYLKAFYERMPLLPAGAPPCRNPHLKGLLDSTRKPSRPTLNGTVERPSRT
jgi:hypothetical protein